MTDISIVGAAGEVGRAFTAHLLRAGIMNTSARLQLVGHGPEASEHKLLAERCDLLDAFHETAPTIDVADAPEAIAADIVVVAAGATISGGSGDRRDLAAANRPLFETLAAALAVNGTGRELAVVVTNPVELGVEILGRHLDRQRVLGMGAQQDSLRFARAIAADAGVRRDSVHAWVCGEHGAAQVPLWSSVRIRGCATPDPMIAQLRGGERQADFAEELNLYRAKIKDLLSQDQIRAAFTLAEALPADLRAAIEPFITFQCLHSTPHATANATLEVVRALHAGREEIVGAQVRLEGEFRDFHTTLGLPVIVDASGWRTVACPPLTDAEAAQLDRAATEIKANLAQWTV